MNRAGLKADFAAGRAQQTTDGVQGGGFPRAVRPEQRHDLALADAEIDAVQRFNAAVTNVQVFDFKQHGGGIPAGCDSGP